MPQRTTKICMGVVAMQKYAIIFKGIFMMELPQDNYSLFKGEIKMYKKITLFSLMIISISISVSAAYEPYGSHVLKNGRYGLIQLLLHLFLEMRQLLLEIMEKLLDRVQMDGHACQ